MNRNHRRATTTTIPMHKEEEVEVEVVLLQLVMLRVVLGLLLLLLVLVPGGSCFKTNATTPNGTSSAAGPPVVTAWRASPATILIISRTAEIIRCRPVSSWHAGTRFVAYQTLVVIIYYEPWAVNTLRLRIVQYPDSLCSFSIEYKFNWKWAMSCILSWSGGYNYLP